MAKGSGKLIVISAPSGCGKTTIAQEILKRHREIEFSLSVTTRKRRESEVDGRDYVFLSRQEFEEKIARGELAEYEIIYGEYYGSLRSPVEKTLREGRALLFDIDVKGALTLKKKYPNHTALIFVKPPSLEILRERLLRRNTEDEASVQRRLERVPMELQEGKGFDYAVINDDLLTAVNEVDEIVKKSIEDC